MISTGGEGKVVARKRVRGKIGNPRNSPEIKMHNLIVNGTDSDVTYYDYMLLKGNFDGSGEQVWWPRRCYWPTTGTSQFQRIGRKIRVKFLRLKGFVQFSPFLITQVRYRLVLYRCKYQDPLNFDFLKSLYNHFGDMASVNQVSILQGYCTHNYYLSYFNNERLKELDCKRRVVYKGLIKPQPDIGNYKIPLLNITSSIDTDPTDEDPAVKTDGTAKIWGPTQNGQTAGWFNGATAASVSQNPNMTWSTRTEFDSLTIGTQVPSFQFSGEFQRHLIFQDDLSNAISPANQKGFFPIDVTVDMNDSIDCQEYMYFFVLESDWCMGQSWSGTFGVSAGLNNWALIFTPQIFYTDD